MQPAHPLPPERRDDLQADLDLSIVIPCLNEVKTLPAAIARASRTIDRLGLRGEVLVSDNGSVDGSIETAELLGARVLHCPERGYGNALRYGMTYARGRGMEFASQMVIKAGLHRMRRAEVPVTLYRDRRDRAPHLRRWRDGWRHLEFMLLHAPDQLLFFPGLVAIVLGLLLTVPVAFGPQHVLGRLFDFHYLFFGGAAVLVGLQGLMGALLVRDVVGGVIMRPNRLASAISRWFSFGRGLLVGGILFMGGAALEFVVLGVWVNSGFGPMSEPRRSVIGMLLMGIGTEIAVFSSCTGFFEST